MPGGGGDLIATIKALHPAGSYLWYGGDATVSSWVDQIQSEDITQGTGTKQPVVGAMAGFNNETVAQFDGTDDTMASSVFTTITQPWTWFMATAVTLTDANNWVVGSTTGINCRIGVRSNGLVRISTGTNFDSSGTVSSNTPALIHGLVNGASSKIFINSTTADATGNAGSGNMTSGVQLASAQGDASPWAEVDLAFLSIYNGNAESDGNLATIHGHLKTIYGL